MPITLKAVPPFVQSVGSGSEGGTVKGEAMKRLQAQQADRTDFTSSQGQDPALFTNRCHGKGHTPM